MFKNTKIKLGLTITFIIVVIISSFAGIVGLFILNNVDANYSTALIEYGFAQGDLGNFGRHFQKQRLAAFSILTANNEPSRTNYVNELSTLDVTLYSDLEAMQKDLISDKDKEVYTNLKTALDNYTKARDTLIKESETIKDDSIIIKWENSCIEPAQAVSDIIDNILNNKSTVGHEKSLTLSNQSFIFSITMIVIIVTSFIISIILAAVYANSISRPILEIKNAAEEMSKGNLNINIKHSSKNELGNLSDSMRTSTQIIKSYIDDIDKSMAQMAEGNFVVEPSQPFIGDFKNIEDSITKFVMNMTTTLNDINTASSQVLTGAEQVSSSSQSLAQGATEQASSIEELSASINDISNQVKENADNAKKAQDLANVSATAIVTSNDQMQEMVVAMNDINKKSNQISKIVKTIEDIAFKTNILALNAAVEAARAGGSAGKGFAVVATEVRTLSSQSAEAAKDTTELIEASILAVENGTRIAAETAKELIDVVSSVQDTSTVINSISNATHEQAVALSQVGIGVNQISSVVQTNSATSEESAAASEELSSQATMMKQLISKFKTAETENEDIVMPSTQTRNQSPFQIDMNSSSKY